MKRRIARLLPLVLALLLVSCGRADRMRSLLEQAEWMNRHGSLFTSDSIGKALVRYYDHWWHPADLRLRAYYMLGCAYRDMGEAPAAIHYYTIATEKADTAHADSATYATLFRVYGQMAMTYEQQNMPQEEIECLDKFSHYALLSRDTLSSIMGQERKVVAYYEMDDTMDVLRLTEEVHQRYVNLGNRQKAARAYPTAIYVSILNHNYARARQYMDFFERESGLFDENGNIAEGREEYYYSKGLYYIAINRTDSAELYFRKLQSSGHTLESSEGFLRLFTELKFRDSVAKYAILAKENVVRWSDKRQADAVIRASALYKYERNQRIAEHKSQEANKAWFTNLILLLIVIYIFIIAFISYRYFRKRERIKEKKYQALEESYDRNMDKYEKLTQEYQILKAESKSMPASSDFQQLIHEKQKMIEELEKRLGWFKDKTEVLKVLENEKKMREEDIVAYFINKAIAVPHWSAPTNDKWDELSELYKKYMPLSYIKIIDLPFQERYACILSHLHFTPGETAMLLETSVQRITNVRKKANEKLSNNAEASSLLHTLRGLAKGVNQV